MADTNPEYGELYNKPLINGVLLVGDKSSQELGFVEPETMTTEDIDNSLNW